MINRKGGLYQKINGGLHRKRAMRAPFAVGESLLGTSAIVNVLAGQEITDQRQETADRREEAADRREEAADQREEAADLRQGIADQRKVTANLRDKALRIQRKTAKTKNELNAETEALLREANEHLVIATVHAQTMKEVAEQATVEMSYMAEHDFLTGLPNRALLTDRLAQSIALAQRNGKKVALMYLDIDHFKDINDSFGHDIGDQLLQSVSKLLQACIRSSDTVSRQGGDEFVVLLPEIVEVQAAIVIAQKLITSMALPHLIGDHQLHVTLSIGISIFPNGGKDLEALARNADTAMYHAKDSGRNNYKVFTPEMNARAVARQSIKAALHSSLEQREFVLHFQPKVNLKNGAITGAEAFLRWQPSDHWLIYPAQFISIAEECGLIMSIGKWVLHEACRQAQVWLQGGFSLGQVAVNISAKEFFGKDFLAGVRAILDDTGLAPHHLELELTENVIMQDTDPSMVILHALKDLGVQIAIDDFGTGYSSLSCLRRFPIDTIKIDQSFVQDIDSEDIVKAIIAMGKSLKQRIVAEGIETRQQLAFLQSQNCAEGQGYYFSRPMAAEEFATLFVTDEY